METPTLRQLEYVVALAHHGHFGRAAQAVHVSQPALSAQIRELEERLGATLFERDRRATRPTPVGNEVARRARSILRDVEDLVAAAATAGGQLTGTVALGAIPTMAPYLLPAVTGAVRNAWPGTTLELTELRTDDLVEAITGGDLDLGLVATPAGTGRLQIREIGDDEFRLTVPTAHHLARRSSVPLAVLADLPVLLLEDGHCLRDQALAACSLAGTVEHAEVRSASLATLSQMVAAGVGVTLLPTSALAVETRAGSGLTSVAFDPPAPRRGIALAWRPSDPRQAHYQHLANALRPRLQPAGEGDLPESPQRVPDPGPGTRF